MPCASMGPSCTPPKSRQQHCRVRSRRISLCPYIVYALPYLLSVVLELVRSTTRSRFDVRSGNARAERPLGNGLEILRGGLNRTLSSQLRICVCATVIHAL